MSDGRRRGAWRILIRRARDRERLRRAFARWIGDHPEATAGGLDTWIYLDSIVPHIFITGPDTRALGCAAFPELPADDRELGRFVAAAMARALATAGSSRP